MRIRLHQNLRTYTVETHIHEYTVNHIYGRYSGIYYIPNKYGGTTKTEYMSDEIAKRLYHKAERDMIALYNVRRGKTKKSLKTLLYNLYEGTYRLQIKPNNHWILIEGEYNNIVIKNKRYITGEIDYIRAVLYG